MLKRFKYEAISQHTPTVEEQTNSLLGQSFLGQLMMERGIETYPEHILNRLSLDHIQDYFSQQSVDQLYDYLQYFAHLNETINTLAPTNTDKTSEKPPYELYVRILCMLGFIATSIPITRDYIETGRLATDYIFIASCFWITLYLMGRVLVRDENENKKEDSAEFAYDWDMWDMHNNHNQLIDEFTRDAKIFIGALTKSFPLFFKPTQDEGDNHSDTELYEGEIESDLIPEWVFNLSSGECASLIMVIREIAFSNYCDKLDKELTQKNAQVKIEDAQAAADDTARRYIEQLGLTKEAEELAQRLSGDTNPADTEPQISIDELLSSFDDPNYTNNSTN